MTTAVPEAQEEAATEATEPPAHICCGLCYPGWQNAGPFELKAICGAELLGIKPPPDADTCEACVEARLEHAVMHAWGDA